jgi:leucyl aminopeptidase
VEIRVECLNQKMLFGDTLVLIAWSDGITAVEGWSGIPKEILNKLWESGKITGKSEEITAVFCSEPTSWEQVVVLGLGDKEKFTPETARLSGAVLARKLRRLKARNIVIAGTLQEKTAAGLIHGFILGDYCFDRYKKSGGTDRSFVSLVFVEEGDKLEQLAVIVDAARIEAKAVAYVRDLVNEPGNTLTPSELANEAQGLAERYQMECSCLDLAGIKQLKMGGLIGVSQGSVEEPRLIVLKYNGDPSGNKQSLGLVGKGVTFDAGGISLKTVAGLHGEKSDMAGGAAVMGALAVIAQLKLPLNVVGIIPATENMPSGLALKPDDILTLMDGTTVEIISTDAEGRLILADAIAYANTLKLSPIVDIATLTGNCSVALGPFYAGLWSNQQGLLEQVQSAAADAGEKVWPMPYDKGFLGRTKGVFADLKNSGGREGGACSAAAFLGHFAKDNAWAHLDIAPTAYADSEKGYTKRGGTGFGVRTLVQLARVLANEP